MSVERALRHERRIVVAALAVLVLLAWAWLLAGAGMEMRPHGALAPVPDTPFPSSAMAMGGDGHEAFSALRYAVIFLMWWVMMVAMMLPSASPTILLYLRSTRHSGLRPAAASFLGGYLAVWGVFSLAAAMLHATLETTGMLSPLMVSRDRWLSGGVLIIAGLYQFSPLKNLCLRHCRNPAWFLTHNFHPGALGALRMGAIHGSYCVGCCWPLMALLFVGGVMNLLWIALLTLVVAAEKLLPFGRYVAIASGVAYLAGGAMMLAG